VVGHVHDPAVPECELNAEESPPVSAAEFAGLEVASLKQGPLWNFSYLAWCRETRLAVVVDPAGDIGRLVAVARANDLEVSRVVLTHAHSDHANGVPDLVALTGAEVIVHEREAGELRRLYAGPVNTFAGDLSLRLGSVDLSLLHTPGHSEGSVSLIAGSYVFTGDTLHVGGPGRPGTFAGAVEALWWSLREKLGPLPGELLVHPGHDEGPTPTSALSTELAALPELSASSPEEFRRRIQRVTGRDYS
jgi:hydroxyacylglutathione hydrolase